MFTHKIVQILFHSLQAHTKKMEFCMLDSMNSCVIRYDISQLKFNQKDDEVATTWLNNEAVRKALHAENVRFTNLHLKILNTLSSKVKIIHLNQHQESVAGKWMICSELDYVSDSGSMIRYHKQLTSLGIRALIYR